MGVRLLRLIGRYSVFICSRRKTTLKYRKTSAHKNEILHPCFIETNVDSSDIVLCIFLGFSISMILVVKKTSTADDQLLQKFSMDLSDVKLETVLKSKVTSLTSLINSILKKKINTVDSKPYFLKTSSL